MPNSGSFIRYNPSTASLGRTFAEALKRKYVDDSLPIRPHQDQGSATQQQSAENNVSIEHIVLGSSKGRIEVEAPGLDKVRRRVANIERNREMSLDGEGVASADDKGDESTSIWNLCRSMSPHFAITQHARGESLKSVAKRCPWLKPGEELDFGLGYYRHRDTKSSSTAGTQSRVCGVLPWVKRLWNR